MWGIGKGRDVGGGRSVKERGLPVVVGRSPAAWEQRRGGQGQEKMGELR